MNGYKKVIVSVIVVLVVSFGAIFWFWPKEEHLPILATPTPLDSETVHGEEYHSDNSKVKILSFFYVKCPDICPLTMSGFQSLQSELKSLGIFGDEVELIAITLDPQNDTEEIVRKYAKAFDADPKGWRWLRLDDKQTNEVSEEFQMYYKKLDSDYISHSTIFYLIDEDHQIRSLYDMANSKVKIDQQRIINDVLLLISDDR